jgi:hypothetical protein
LHKTNLKLNQGARHAVPLFLFSLLAAGCATLAGERPPDFKSYTLPASYEEAWGAVLEVLQVELIPIAEQNELEGRVTSEEFPIQKNEFHKWAENAALAPSGFGAVHLNLVRKSSEVSRLEIACDFQAARRSVIRKKGKRSKSTGVFENALAARVYTCLIGQKHPNLFQVIVGCNFRWDELSGFYEVSSVGARSLGEEQGFQIGDRILKIDGTEIRIDNFFSLMEAVRKNEIKTFTLDREGRTIELPVQVFYLRPDLPWFGMRVERDPVTAKFRVYEVAPSSPAGVAGFQAGDFLLEEEGISLSDWKSYYSQMTGAILGEDRHFLVERNGTELPLTVKPMELQPV